MAEAFFNRYSRGTALAFSAGTHPARYKDSNVVEAMNEIGVDLGNQCPKKLNPDMMKDVDRVITMGCGIEGVCPDTFTASEDWALADPKEKPVEEVRDIRDRIEIKVRELINRLQT